VTSSIPHHLDLVIDYVNTLDPERGTDDLATSSAAIEWLAGRGLLKDHRASLGADDLEHAVRLREALRALMLDHNGARFDPRATRELEQVARRGDLAVHFDEHATVRLEPGNDGLPGALASLLVPVASASADGTWLRVKACRAEDCQWAFYDRSRNRSGTWCEMAICGNRTKVRAYRQRRPQRP
jgi:predicted RNA-binding Zn ribbon-like protein